MSCILCALFWPAFLCYSATFATEQINNKIADTLYESNWYDFPPELQKYVVLIIARTQDTVYFTGMNLIGCTLEIFGKVTTEN